MTDRQKWLLKQPTFYLGIIVTTFTTMIAVGIPLQHIIVQWIAVFVAVCSAYGITAAHMTNPPRVPWTNEERIAHGLPPLPMPPAPPTPLPLPPPEK